MTAPAAPAPFTRAAVLGLVGIGGLLLVAALWLIGAGLNMGSANDGGSHGAGKGLGGYAALSALLERQGWQVREARTESMLQDPGLVVLTPPHGADGAELARLVAARRHLGPTLVVTPKWLTQPLDKLPRDVPGAQPGWTAVQGAQTPHWPGFLDEVGVAIRPLAGGQWRAATLRGGLPDPRAVLAGSGPMLVPLVVGAGREGPILAAYVADDGAYPALERMALTGGRRGDAQGGLYPLVVVFEPDLIDNYGLSQRPNALLALALVEAAADGAPRRVTFDLTLNGLGRRPNLLTLAFTPPFLAATLCLLAAALIAGWRAFLRFGPARQSGPELAPGKAALVANIGGLIRRSRRLPLLGGSWRALVRERLARKLALPRHADPAATEAAIDRALASRAPGATPFSTAARHVAAARRPAELLAAARHLHALERTLTE